ncbi:MAG: prepilin-type N-terminal cleavage/methylation domain-containing protein [Opitutus sp.]
MSRTSVHSRRGAAGFTLTEILIATSLSAILFAAVFSAYLFLGRILTRLVNVQRQENESRRTLRYFTQDVSAAIRLTTATASQVTLTRPTSGGTTTVTYEYSSGGGTLARTQGGNTQTLVSQITAGSFAFSYYNESGSTVSTLQSIKSVEMSFSTTFGSSNAGTRASYTTVSPRIVLRNKPALNE